MKTFTNTLTFDIQPRTRLICGPGSSAEVVSYVKSLVSIGTRPARVLVVSDAGIVQAGHFGRVADRLREAGLEVGSFHDFGENPTSGMVDRAVQAAAEFQPDVLIGLGGGSSLDCCKGMNFVYSGGGRIHDYHGVGKATADMLPMIAIPTTSGTGSETQSFALISDDETHIKMACGDPKAACKIAVLDPELTLTQPPRITALTGIDALSHAIETYVTRRRNAMSTMYSRQAFGLLARSFEKVIADGSDVNARCDMQLGASLAGMAIETSMLGAAHATANPLTARHDIVHGQAVGLMLPAVIRFNGTEHADWYADLMREIEPEISEKDSPDRLAEQVEDWMRAAGLATSLDELSVPSSDIGMFVDDALEQWTGTFNPIALDEDSVRMLYREVA
ncbi:alcohol dehydrogenase/alcohol dehydrogenase [Neorhodopirellula lusitana]|uniref:Alcohol dehydrogenase/alcohol dehydrogenase n=1 Tax=Neorhodopirellula lusitana TaxID=445327 RepID=A0ABY1QRG1_9BACT|nr:iron-containing alcohol dehydrogenase [Neorhodopirellula lusitana]SMP78425.1 alcohol dehydrogenase/alcohol dehydrogenase [Neorhodopirellula lusitana]